MFFRQSDITKQKKEAPGWSQKSGVGMHLRSQNLEIQGGKTIRGKKDQKILNCENLPFARHTQMHGGEPEFIVNQSVSRPDFWRKGGGPESEHGPDWAYTRKRSSQTRLRNRDTFLWLI